MATSIVRWLISPDTWDFTENIKPSATNPKEQQTTSAYSVATWLVSPDTWNQESDIVLSNILLKFNNKYYTYQNNEFIEVEPTQENFENYSINLSEIITPINKLIFTMKYSNIIGDGKIYRRTIDLNKIGEVNKITIL